MALTLAEIRAKLQAQENRASNAGNPGSGESVIYPHWNIKTNDTARIRFLPDGDPNNPYFWVERAVIKLPFSGVVGQPDSKPVEVQVPCMEMYKDGGPCPILAEVRPWFKDPALEDLGRKYWKKRSYLFQGFVRENPLADDNPPENPIRRFVISPQIFNLIKNVLLDPELENLPTDYMAGLDFNIQKTEKGGYADYTTSTWARRESALNKQEQAAIEQYGLFTLSEFLPTKPTDTELKIIKEMFEASVDGQPYDPERWAAYYAPYGLKRDGDDSAKQEKTSVPVNSKAAPAASTPVQYKATVAESSDPPFDADTEADEPVEKPMSDSQKRAEDILAMIRQNRNKQ